MGKRNCWEIMACGLGPRPDGASLARRICPAALPGVYAGMNHGQCRGRFCWAIPGTLCDGGVQDCVPKKLAHCLGCEVMRAVNAEEGREFTVSAPWRRRVDDFA